MAYSLNQAKSHYDVIVIGSGLAGLTAANVLGKNGYRVAVLEHHYNFGGLASVAPQLNWPVTAAAMAAR